MKKALFVACYLLLSRFCTAQIDTVAFSLQAAHLFPSFPIKSSYTSLFDRRSGFEFLYSANMEFGLGVYDLSSPGAIQPILDLPVLNFDGLDVSTMAQRGNTLFLGIGDFHVKNNPASGLAVVDISHPLVPVVKAVWDSTLFTHGISHLLLDGNYAYLSTMSDGIIILEISEEDHPRFVSRLALDLNFPAPSANAHNARGLEIRNDTLYVCFDRGGLRVVDVKDKYHPAEIYAYINTTLNSQAAAAYNEIAIKGHYAFVSVDYCGLEVIDIGSFPFSSVQWYNPWGCNDSNWSGAAIHTNEVALANNDSLLFVTAGQSDLFVFDVSDPAHAHKAGEYAMLNDTLASHGLDVNDNRVALSFLHTPFHIPPFTPFFSDPGGLKILEYQVEKAASLVLEPYAGEPKIQIFPNPATGGEVWVESETGISAIRVLNALGNTVYETTGAPSKHLNLNTGNWNAGLYFLKMQAGEKTVMERLMVLK